MCALVLFKNLVARTVRYAIWPKVTVFGAQFGKNGPKIAPTHSFEGVKGLFSPELCEMGVPIRFEQKVRFTHFVR